MPVRVVKKSGGKKGMAGSGQQALDLDSLCNNLIKEGRLLPGEAALLRAAPRLLAACEAALAQIGRCCRSSDGKPWHRDGCATPMLEAVVASVGLAAQTAPGNGPRRRGRSGV